MADCTPLAVVSKSLMTADMETFISDVSTTRTNIAIASSTISLRLPCCPGSERGFVTSLTCSAPVPYSRGLTGMLENHSRAGITLRE